MIISSHRAREREESRADDYNAYHKIAVAVAEVWGSAIPDHSFSQVLSQFWKKIIQKY